MTERTHMAVSFPNRLIREIDELAEKEHRSRASMAYLLISHALQIWRGVRREESTTTRKQS